MRLFPEVFCASVDVPFVWVNSVWEPVGVAVDSVKALPLVITITVQVLISAQSEGVNVPV